MASDFDLTMNAQAARSLLSAVGALCGELVETALKRLDARTAGGGLSMDEAMGICHEIAAYRRIVRRLGTGVTRGDHQAARLVAEGYTERSDA